MVPSGVESSSLKYVGRCPKKPIAMNGGGPQELLPMSACTQNIMHMREQHSDMVITDMEDWTVCLVAVQKWCMCENIHVSRE